MAGIHCCSLHHSQSQEEGEGEEREGGGEDGSGKKNLLYNLFIFINFMDSKEQSNISNFYFLFFYFYNKICKHTNTSNNCDGK